MARLVNKNVPVTEKLNARLQRISRFTRIPQAVVMREGLEMAVAKWEAKLEQFEWEVVKEDDDE